MILIKTIIALVIFGIIILIHEFGHFIAAKACKVKVDEFSLGMGPRLFTIHGKSTDYSLKLLPIGGSCAMKGETDDSISADQDSFQNKKPCQRFLIIFAGPAFNFILSMIVALILCANLGTDIPFVSDVLEGKPAAGAGILPGDKIVKINGRNIKLYREVYLYNTLNEGVEQDITVERAGSTLKLHLTPEYDAQYGRFLIGVTGPSDNVFPDSPGELFSFSFYELRYNILMAVDSLVYLFKGHFSPDSVMGPVGIISSISDTVEQAVPYGLKILLLTVADYILLFSTNVGVLNLLPFPALDGGRLVLIIIEMITGRPLNRKLENYINLAGFVILMLLILFISVNDIGRLL